MNKNFGRILALLRKKKGLSQKQVANDLGISQALLSHYEKGIRECGLSFLVKTAEYFEVSTDYLLGLTDNPANLSSVESAVQLDQSDDAGNNVTNTYYLINRKLIVNSVTLIYNILSEIDSKKLNRFVSDYLMTALYTVFRKIHSMNPENPTADFDIKYSVENYSNASMNLDLAKISRIKAEQKDKTKVDLSADNLSRKHPDIYGSLHSLIRNVEKNITSKFKI